MPGFPAESPSFESSQGDDNSDSPPDDKRKRNTEASARFRQKKKERFQNLSKTIDQLESKAQNLEKEATSLRTENTWLKEMVIMKGRSNLKKQGSGGSAGPTEGESDDDEE